MLIFNGSVTSSGAVDIALSADRRPTPQPLYTIIFATRSEGNLVNELDNRNPTALLVSAIENISLPGKRRKMMGSILGCCEMETCGKFIVSCPEVPRAERSWRLRPRPLLGKTHPFR